MKRSLKRYTYPENLYRAVIGEDKELPTDYKETAEYVLELMPSNVRIFLIDEMKNKYPDSMLGKELGMDRNEIIKLRRRSLYELKDHPVKDILILGMTEYFKRKEADEEATKADVLKTSVTMIGLSRQTEYLLINQGLLTINDILQYEDLRTIRYLGYSKIDEIDSKLRSFGVVLKRSYYTTDGKIRRKKNGN